MCCFEGNQCLSWRVLSHTCNIVRLCWENHAVKYHVHYIKSLRYAWRQCRKVSQTCRKICFFFYTSRCFFCTSQIDDVSMNDVTSTHVWEITSCPGLEFNDVTSCFNRKYLGPNGPRYFRVKHSVTPLNFSSPGQEYIITLSGLWSSGPNIPNHHIESLEDKTGHDPPRSRAPPLTKRQSRLYLRIFRQGLSRRDVRSGDTSGGRKCFPSYMHRNRSCLNVFLLIHGWRKSRFFCRAQSKSIL